jgi:3'-5' exoribonuclease-like protein
MPFNSVMLDLETMGTSKDAAIVAIGAVRFDLNTGLLGDKFYQVINLKSAQRAGGKIDADSVMFWLQQSDEARKAITSDDGVHIEAGIKAFSEWIRSVPVAHLWGNGSDFDNVILEGAYNRLGWTPPWAYKQNRCYRTLVSLYASVEKEDSVIPHQALEDAIAQANHLCKIWRSVNYES